VSQLSEQSVLAIAMLIAGTLAASAVGRLLYQLALTETKNDNGAVSMFFLLIPAVSALISWPLSSWIPTLSFVPGPAFAVGMAFGQRTARRPRLRLEADLERRWLAAVPGGHPRRTIHCRVVREVTNRSSVQNIAAHAS
jgi:hypothetical protein